MPTLSIKLLGFPQVTWNNAPVHILRKAPRALLFYLACESGGATRSRLCELFWPEEEEDTSRSKLRTLLAKLRAALPDPTLVITDQDHVSLDRTRLELDVALYRRIGQPAQTATIHHPSTVPLPEPIFQQVSAAHNMWRFPRFMADLSLSTSPGFERWAADLGRLLESSHLALILIMINHAAATGNLEAAIHLSYTYLQIDDLADEVYARVLTWLVTLGRRGEALAMINQVQSLFEEHEGIPVPEGLAQVCGKIRQAQEISDEPAPVNWPPAMQTRVKFSGRLAELDQLKNAFLRGGVAFVRGEAGSGKTRLLFELARELTPPRATLMVLHCRPAYAALALQPLANVLRSRFKADWEALPLSWRLRLKPLMLEGMAEPPNPLASSRRELFEALHYLLRSLVTTERMLMVLDGAQWCDRTTLDFLAYLAEQRFWNHFGLLAVTCRVEEPCPWLEQWQIDLPPLLPKTELSLLPLDNHSLRQLVHSFLQVPPQAEVVERLQNDTGGNPQLIIETLQTILESAGLPGRAFDLEHGPLPESLAQMLIERWSRLGAETQQVLEAAVVCGQSFPLGLLESCTDLPQAAFTTAVEELQRAAFISIQPNLLCAFVHGRMPEAVLQKINLVRRRTLHLCVAQALAQQPPTTRTAAEMAQHYEDAGEPIPAVNAWLQAAEFHVHQAAPHEAYQAFRRAEILVQQAGSLVSDQLLHRLYTAWGETAFQWNDPSALTEAYTALQKFGEQRGSPLLIGSALSGLANTHYPGSFDPQKMDLIEQALSYLRQAEDGRELAEALNRRGSLLMLKGALGEATQAFEQALQTAGEDPAEASAHTRFQVAHHLNITLMLAGWPERARASAERALAEALQLKAAIGIAQAHLALAASLSYLGSPEQALVHFRLGLPLADQFKQSGLAAPLHATAAQVELAAGRLDTCAEHVRQVSELAAQTAGSSILNVARSTLGHLHLMLGDADGALTLYRLPRPVENNLYDQFNSRYLLALARPQPDSLAEVEETIRLARQAGLGSIFLPAELVRAWLLVRRGSLEEAAQAAQRLQPELEERGENVLAVLLHLVNAAIVWKRSGFANAIPLLEQAVQQARHFSFLWAELMAQHLLEKAGAEGSQAAVRKQELLESLSQNCRSPYTRPLFERFAYRLPELTF